MMNQVGMELRRSPIGWRMSWLFFEFWHGGERSGVSQEASGD